jgi:phosphoribosyl 1,2-cyclic phosphodiesterase
MLAAAATATRSSSSATDRVCSSTAAFGTRTTLAARLRTIGVAPESIDGCLLTPEHHDHLKGTLRPRPSVGVGHLRHARNARARALRKTPVLTFEPGLTLDFPRG